MKRRPSRKKTTGVSARERGRLRPMVTITLSPEGVQAADELAALRGLPSRSVLIEQLIFAEARRERVGMYKEGRP